MKAQPDLHHEGPLTVELVDDLLDKLKNVAIEIDQLKSKDIDQEFIHCLNAWTFSINDAGMYCAAVLAKLTNKVEFRPENDRKVVDITLCILRDYEEAKATNFFKTMDK